MFELWQSMEMLILDGEMLRRGWKRKIDNFYSDSWEGLRDGLSVTLVFFIDSYSKEYRI